MTVKILIKRRFKDGNFQKASEMLIRARSNVLQELGYISSETLRSCDDPNEIVVVSMWEKIEDWNRYKNNPSRKELETEFSKLLDGQTIYAPYNLGLYA
ncbi:MAG: hypothetical protein HOG03_24810 [Desulfobacula sp.]|jgi:quinol monooxygenase YgiN|uniref:antibiotic biosynthesis monooxygenase family protein n=1 Tax=Desulfobacula sp. TaxID=2593537 RepID=UPI001DD354E4|nr:hypothetical protein [Desulfobacula sp.]MBT4027729.1 hypothetical protein [Desulfobacula sp.]MBT4199923.1 hypothetical protein [Desulfobacula sp.]MBT4508795.1 hypothetical protein [Desulfobacula sp.]MBT4875053.1 hypothetical protein [Desulfobacula sp.]